MASDPWLSIIGLGEDGPGGLSAASQKALQDADVIMGPERHLSLLSETPQERVVWPVPFTEGIPKLLALKGRKVAVLVSGNPFWFGAGSVLARTMDASEYEVFPAPSIFSRVAARMGWPLEGTQCFGLHAAPFERLRPSLAPGAKIIATVRDGQAVGDLASYLIAQDFEKTRITICEAMGGPRERVRSVSIDAVPSDIRHPVAIALEVEGNGRVLSRVSGLDDAWFKHDGQITKRPVRALALSALAPRPGELLWDIGTGSGSVAIEWLLSDPTVQAIGFEANAERAARARENAAALGVHRLSVVETRAPLGLSAHPAPNVVFIGGGASQPLLETLFDILPKGTRLVAHAVTLESEALLAIWHADKGGSLLRIELAEAQALGTRRGWKSAYPIVQWSVTL